MNKQLSRLFSAALPLGIALSGLTVFAQSAQSQEILTTCEYDSALGFENPLGGSGDFGTGEASMVVTNVDGVTAFAYRFIPPREVRGDDGQAVFNNPQLFTEKRLTFFDTTLESARQQMLDNPEYYAELVGGTVEGVSRLGGYGAFDRTLTCKEATASREPDAPTRETAFDSLPDGNYRVTSANFPFRIVNTQELLESEGTVFLFKKVGNSVSGDFFYPETDSSICIEGTLRNDMVSGRARLDGTEAMAPDSDVLSIGNQSMGGRFSDATLDLRNFSRINAGTVLPRESCG